MTIDRECSGTSPFSRTSPFSLRGVSPYFFPTYNQSPVLNAVPFGSGGDFPPILKLRSFCGAGMSSDFDSSNTIRVYSEPLINCITNPMIRGLSLSSSRSIEYKVREKFSSILRAMVLFSDCNSVMVEPTSCRYRSLRLLNSRKTKSTIMTSESVDCRYPRKMVMSKAGTMPEWVAGSILSKLAPRKTSQSPFPAGMKLAGRALLNPKNTKENVNSVSTNEYAIEIIK